jgi:trigger factor
MRIEVKPEIALTAWQGIEVAVPPAEVAGEAVDAEIQRLREGHKEQVAVEGRGADIGDVLMVDTHGTIDGETDERLHTHAMRIRLGDEGLLPGLGDQLMGATAEETRSIRLTFPDDFQPEALAGKEAAMEVKVEQHFVEEVPDLDDDLAQDLGHDTLAELTEAVTARLTTQAEEVRSQAAEDKIVRVLLERHGFEVPRAMLAAQFQHQARMTAMRLQIQGAPQEMISQLLEQNRDAILAQAGMSVRRYLALETLARQEGLTISDEALDAEITKRVAEAPPNRAPSFEEPEAREGLHAELLEQAALALLREHAVITDAEPEPEPALDTSADVDDDAPAADPAESPAGDEGT